MPAQLVHIAYGLAYLKTHTGLEEGVFMRGSVFPDIRRMAGCARGLTHRLGLQLSDVAAENDSWRAGLLLHSYLDEAWNVYFRELGLQVEGEMDEIHWAAVKVAEESDFFGTIEGRERVSDFLKAPPLAPETEIVPDQAVIQRWYDYISWKLSRKYDPEAWRRHAVAVKYYPNQMERLLGKIEWIRCDEAWQQRLKRLNKYLGI